MIMIDEKLGIYSDPHNFILIENPVKQKKGWSGKKHYFPNFVAMVKFISDLKAFEFVARGMPYSEEKSKGKLSANPNIDHLNEVIDEYSNYLQKHLEEIGVKNANK